MAAGEVRIEVVVAFVVNEGLAVASAPAAVLLPVQGEPPSQ